MSGNSKESKTLNEANESKETNKFSEDLLNENKTEIIPSINDNFIITDNVSPTLTSPNHNNHSSLFKSSDNINTSSIEYKESPYRYEIS